MFGLKKLASLIIVVTLFFFLNFETVYAQTYYGNEFLVKDKYYTKIDSTSDKGAIRFVAQADKTLTGVRLACYETGTSPSYIVEVQTDDGTANHYPSGNLAWTNASGTLSITGSGWAEVALTSSGALSKETIYHIVVYTTDAGVDASNCIGLYRSGPRNDKWINGVTTNEERASLFNDGTGWSAYAIEPIYVLDYGDTTYEGNPYYTASIYSIYGVYFRGEEFTPSEDVTVNVIAVYARCNSTTKPDDDLYYRLEKSDKTLVREGTLITKTDVTNVWGWIEKSISSVTLSSGTTYRLFLKSPNSTSTYCYEWNMPDDAKNAAPYNGLTYDGTNSLYCGSTNSGDTWTTQTGKDAAFRFTESSIVKIIIQKWRELYQ